MTRRPVELIRLTKTDVEHALDAFSAEPSVPHPVGGADEPAHNRPDSFDLFASEVRAPQAAIGWKRLAMPGVVAASIVAMCVIVIVIANGSETSRAATTPSSPTSSSELFAAAPDLANVAIRESPATVPRPNEQPSLTTLETFRIGSAAPALAAAPTVAASASPTPSAGSLPMPAADVSTTPTQPRPVALDPPPVVTTEPAPRVDPINERDSPPRLATENIAASPPPPSLATPLTTPEPVARPVAPPNETAAIERVLTRYRDAYSTLDAGAARDVWPTVNEKALEKAFDRLEEQDLAFANCLIAVTSSRARAECSGTARYVPKVGSKSPRLDQRQWNFSLRKDNEEWVIESVSAR